MHAARDSSTRAKAGTRISSCAMSAATAYRRAKLVGRTLQRGVALLPQIAGRRVDRFQDFSGLVRGRTIDQRSAARLKGAREDIVGKGAKERVLCARLS